ncbi:MAG: ATP-binding protein [Gammaproteobacteria bacterium]
MKLRTVIVVFLLVFALVPLVAVVMMNFPLVFDRLQFFYHKAHLQNLRADFRDLDQHLASRNEMLRLLAKMPETTALVGKPEGPYARLYEDARGRFSNWANQVLGDHRDINQVLFLDADGEARFWLSRNSQTNQLEKTEAPEHPPNEGVIEAARNSPRGGVFSSPLLLDSRRGAKDPSRFMVIQLFSPIVLISSDGTPRYLGAVFMDIDVGGLAKAYPGTLWARNDGRYLDLPGQEPHPSTAFKDMPGLRELFETRELSLWRGEDNRQVMWIPLFQTRDGNPLWVGRIVDPSPITAFGSELRIRVAIIVAGLALLVWLLARWIAVRVEGFGQELILSLRCVLSGECVAKTRWERVVELRDLENNLAELSEQFSDSKQRLVDHAMELEESNRYKSQFLANVSHELRTPLNSILLLSKLLAQDSHKRLDDEQKRQATVINEAGRDLKSLIDNILDLSRIEAGKLIFEIGDFDPREIIESSVDVLRPLFDEKNLPVKLEIDPEAPRVISSDREKIGQIIRNFLSNAVKFTETGQITVGLQCTGSAKRPLRIDVRDTGIGIPQSKHDVIFDAFQQADGSTNRRFGGTGLGLAISRELAESLGGRITLESAEGAGSCFSLHLPLEADTSGLGEDQVALREPERNESPVPTIADEDFVGQRVLVVDDDLRNLLALTPLLEGWNLEVLGAGDGGEALDTLETEDDLALVLLDMMMPDMDGFAVLKRLREMDDFAELPVISLTAMASPEDEAACLNAGASAYLSKPVDTEALLTTLRRFLK